MNIIGHGISLIDVRQINEIYKQKGQYLEKHCLTMTERELARLRIKRVQFLAGRIAAKKAVFQALGQEGESIPWRSIEIQRLPTGKPFVVLYGTTLKVATELSIDEWLISISHTPVYGTASALALGEEAETTVKLLINYFNS
ncbi:MAG: holo-ACP synthase [Cyanobacteria bacterium P01_A01_bin.83]